MSTILQNNVITHQDTGIVSGTIARFTAHESLFTTVIKSITPTPVAPDLGSVISPKLVQFRLVSGSDVLVSLDNGTTYPLRLSGVNDMMTLRVELEGLRATGSITAGADAANSLAGDYLDIYDRNGPVRAWFRSGGAAASGTITYGAPDPADTVEVDGTTFTEGVDFSSIFDLTAAINALPDVIAEDDGTVITITAAASGTAGNSITMSVGGGNTGTLVVSGATLTGGLGSGSTPATPGGGRLLAVDYSVNDSADTMASLLAAALDADAEFIATASGPVVSVTDQHIGTRTAISAGTTGWGVSSAAGTGDEALLLVKSADASEVVITVVPG